MVPGCRPADPADPPSSYGCMLPRYRMLRDNAPTHWPRTAVCYRGAACYGDAMFTRSPHVAVCYQGTACYVDAVPTRCPRMAVCYQGTACYRDAALTRCPRLVVCYQGTTGYRDAALTRCPGMGVCFRGTVCYPDKLYLVSYNKQQTLAQGHWATRRKNIEIDYTYAAYLCTWQVDAPYAHIHTLFYVHTSTPLKCSVNISKIDNAPSNKPSKTVNKRALHVEIYQSVKVWTTPMLQLIIKTHLPLDNVAAFLADEIFKRIFLNENFRILIIISLKFVSKGPIDNTSSLVQVMAWRRTGDKQLPEAMMIQFTDAYMRH